jgi:hypothetical protein
MLSLTRICSGEVAITVWTRPRLANFRAAVDVLGMRPRQAGDHGVLGAPGDFADRLEITLGSDREARLDDIDAHVVEHLGDFELLLEGHGGARALFAVAQGGVEYNDAVLVGLVHGGHRKIPLGVRCFERRRGLVISRNP